MARGRSIRPRVFSGELRACSICGHLVVHYRNGLPHKAHLASWECRRVKVLGKEAKVA